MPTQEGSPFLCCHPQLFPALKSVLSSKSGGRADAYVKQGDTIKIGNTEIEVRETPGHTNGIENEQQITFRLSYLCAGLGEVGHDRRRLAHTRIRKDGFPAGFVVGAQKMVPRKSTHPLQLGVEANSFTLGRLGTLPRPQLPGTISDECCGRKGFSFRKDNFQKYNPRFTLDEEKFVEFMNNLHLPYPSQIGNTKKNEGRFQTELFRRIFSMGRLTKRADGKDDGHSSRFRFS